ncbi:hypothetical protein [Chryseobacterium aurantiacum]|uniref:hypothetical protein n=1 Tax=Chryseobacterium aurantiacum TaxID=2116499 RepID=UPI000D12B6B4|nr:hypothetical protein [Chryseobacterium aurantiacum]
MKRSDMPTEYLLVKAKTNSEWDACDFAIINITGEWKQTQKKRLEVIKIIETDEDIKSLNYFDTHVEFFRFSKVYYPVVEEWLSERNRVFIELEKEDLKELKQPKNSLCHYQMQISKDGNAIYKAYGKPTEEEFRTVEFSLWELIDFNTHLVINP